MKTTKIKRDDVFTLQMALQVTGNLSVPAKFRYAIKRNTDLISPHLEASRIAYPRPKDAEGKELPDNDPKVMAWRSEWDKHMAEVMEIDLYKTELVEIDDTVNFPDLPAPKENDPEWEKKNMARHEQVRARNRQNQALISALAPIFRDGE